jgi:hypothetical protein
MSENKSRADLDLLDIADALDQTRAAIKMFSASRSGKSRPLVTGSTPRNRRAAMMTIGPSTKARRRRSSPSARGSIGSIVIGTPHARP